MGKLLRRFTIIVLTMTVFAFLLSALAAQPERRVHNGTRIPCLHPGSTHCVALL